MTHKPAIKCGLLVHPGAIMREDYLAERGDKPEDFAKASSIPLETLSAILEEREPLTFTIALKFVKEFGGGDSDAEMLMRIQETYNLNKPSQSDPPAAVTPPVLSPKISDPILPEADSGEYSNIWISESGSHTTSPDYWRSVALRLQTALEGLPAGGFKPGDLTTHGARPPRDAEAYRMGLPVSTVTQEGLRVLARADGTESSRATEHFTSQCVPSRKTIDLVPPRPSPFPQDLMSADPAEILERLRRLNANEWLQHRSGVIAWLAMLVKTNAAAPPTTD